MPKIRVKPKEGLVILDPITLKQIPAEGALVVQSSYWVRALKTGDVTLVEKKEKKTELVAPAQKQDAPKLKQNRKAGVK